jgi:hypothetical protein
MRTRRKLINWYFFSFESASLLRQHRSLNVVTIVVTHIKLIGCHRQVRFPLENQRAIYAVFWLLPASRIPLFSCCFLVVINEPAPVLCLFSETLTDSLACVSLYRHSSDLAQFLFGWHICASLAYLQYKPLITRSSRARATIAPDRQALTNINKFDCFVWKG